MTWIGSIAVLTGFVHPASVNQLFASRRRRLDGRVTKPYGRGYELADQGFSLVSPNAGRCCVDARYAGYGTATILAHYCWTTPGRTSAGLVSGCERR
jgi:hypothetical protein